MKLFQTNINHLLKVQSACKLSQKMDVKGTFIMLGADNKELLNKATEAMGEAIRLLGEMSPQNEY